MARRVFASAHEVELVVSDSYWVAVVVGSILSPERTDKIVGYARCHGKHTLQQNKGVYMDCETGEDSARTSIGCEGSISHKKECSLG